MSYRFGRHLTFGNTWWNAYDPAGRSVSLASEAEMRIWIEKRYR